MHIRFRHCALAVLFTVVLAAEARFDMEVRQDFFAGFAGNQEALARAMAKTEQVLAANPKHAEALVWHGAGLLSSSAGFFQRGDMQKGIDLFMRGQQEMDAAVEIAPENLGVRIPRGSVLMAAGRNLMARRPEQGRDLMAKALTDFEYTYGRQKNVLSSLGEHPAGELLFAIADLNSRLGNLDRASEFFDRIETLLPDSPYAKRAAMWKQTKSLSIAEAGCIGCHTGSSK